MDVKKKGAPLSEEELLPVSLLCGFLGAGKTTLMKHILETKHADEDFRCAVIVNDMATLNIDKSLIDQSALVQSDEVIAMQNGCFCCTLQSDLVDQIISLTEKRTFNYMLIEASGVSEPSQIAPLFDLCDDEHDPDDPDGDHDHDKAQLGEVARLDTCITVVDSAEFYNNLGSMKTYEQGETLGTIAELMMEQVEFSNVVVLNKGDLVNEEQQSDIMEKITLLNPKAKVVKSVQSKVNVMDILNTHLYEANKSNEEFWVSASKAGKDEVIEAALLECCEKSMAKDGKKCCKSQSAKLVDTGLSQVQLDVVPDINSNARQITRHEARFGIKSFVYRARRPFHPGRLVDLMVDPFFMLSFLEDEQQDAMEKEYQDENDEGMEKKEKLSEEEKQKKLQKDQREANSKKNRRIGAIGDVLRSKGFVWIATSHDVLGSWQQAGNLVRIETESPWLCEMRWMWEGTPSESLVLEDMRQPNGEEYKYKDRRQELVFIGQGLKHEVIQRTLDACLLDDHEYSLGPEMWKETMEDDDTIQLSLSDDEEEEDDESPEKEEGEESDTVAEK